jgi:hypothetical protein
MLSQEKIWTGKAEAKYTVAKGKERKGKERKGKERKGKERKGKERKECWGRGATHERRYAVSGRSSVLLPSRSPLRRTGKHTAGASCGSSGLSHRNAKSANSQHNC